MSKKRLDREVERARGQADVLARIESLQGSPEINDWESEFLDNIYDLVMSGVSLSQKQQDKLDEIEDVAENGRDDVRYGW